MFLFAAAFGVAAFVGLTAFDGENDQQAEIDAAIETQLNDFRSEKQMECQTSALAAAQMKADSVLAGKPGKPAPVKKEVAPAPTKPAPTKPKPTATKPTPPVAPPPPPPAKPEPVVPGKGGAAAGQTGTTTNTGGKGAAAEGQTGTTAPTNNKPAGGKGGAAAGQTGTVPGGH